MFRYYQKAAICYAYLADVPSDFDEDLESSIFSSSRWFTRGWTLQELIAPSKVNFYSSDWKKLGSKASLRSLLSKISKIDSSTLKDATNIQHVSVAQKMAWAANRMTTRIEDMAYCLLGIFNINMPLLYGEGEKAFLRLQEEIMKVTEDQSIFAWSRSPISHLDLSLRQDNLLYRNIWHQRHIHNGGIEQTDTWQVDVSLLMSFLATSPADFASSSHVESLKYWPGYDSSVPLVRGESIRIEVPVFIDQEAKPRWQACLSASIRDLTFALLGCRLLNKREYILAVPLLQWDARFYGRYGDPVLIPATRAIRDASWLKRQMKTMEIKAEPPRGGFRPRENGDILVSFEGSFEPFFGFEEYVLSAVYLFGNTTYDPTRQLLRNNDDTESMLLLAAFHFRGSGRWNSRTVAFLVGRTQDSTIPKFSGCFMRPLIEDRSRMQHFTKSTPKIHSITESEFFRLFEELSSSPRPPSGRRLRLKDLSVGIRFSFNPVTDHIGAQALHNCDVGLKSEKYFDILRLFGTDTPLPPSSDLADEASGSFISVEISLDE
jgi:hypothetical protein